MRRFFRSFVIVALVLYATTCSVFALSGNGTESNPYLIEDAVDWVVYTSKLAVARDIPETPIYAELGANINLSDANYKVRNVSGTLDGNGYTISGLNKPLYQQAVNMTIQNLSISADIYEPTRNHNLSSGLAVGCGAIARYGEELIIRNCFVGGTIHSMYDSGALLGSVGGTVAIEACVTNATVIASENSPSAGGVIGYIGANSTVIIREVVAAGSVRAVDGFAGGLVGSASSDNVSVAIANSAAYQRQVAGKRGCSGRVFGGGADVRGSASSVYAFEGMIDESGSVGDFNNESGTGFDSSYTMTVADAISATFWSRILSSENFSIADGRTPVLKTTHSVMMPSATIPEYLQPKIAFGDGYTVTVTDIEQPCVIALAAFRGSKFLQVSLVETDASWGGDLFTHLTLTAEDTVRVFVFDNLRSLTPLCESAELVLSPPAVNIPWIEDELEPPVDPPVSDTTESAEIVWNEETKSYEVTIECPW